MSRQGKRELRRNGRETEAERVGKSDSQQSPKSLVQTWLKGMEEIMIETVVTVLGEDKGGVRDKKKLGSSNTCADEIDLSNKVKNQAKKSSRMTKQGLLDLPERGGSGGKEKARTSGGPGKGVEEKSLREGKSFRSSVK